MPIDKSTAEELRRRAEAKAEPARFGCGDNAPAVDASRLLQELQVHKVELEMQNEELNDAAEKISFLLKEFTELYDFAPIGYFAIGRDGLIKRANLMGAKLFHIDRAKLNGKTFRHFINAESRHRFAVFLSKLENARDGDVGSCEATLTRADHSACIVQLNAMVTEGQQVFNIAVTDISELKRLEREREVQGHRIRELSRSLVALQENERRKLGTQLHDRISGNLAALDLLLKDLGESMPAKTAMKLSPQMEDIKGLLLETTQSIREISSEIRPALLDHGGLIPTLEEYAARFTKHSGIAVEVRAETERRLRPDLESVLFRITQEALANCVKHSHAKSVKIVFASPADRIVLSIEDDGHGFMPESLFESAAQPGPGILSMKERAEFCGGLFSLKSTPGKGARITVEFKRSQDNPLWVVRKGDRRRSSR